jgi:hypothetical protein
MGDKGLLRLRLLRDDATPPNPDGGAYRFGLQDNREVLHEGVPNADGKLAFDFALRVAAAEDESQPPVLTGSFAFGRPQDRFVYLSWQREGETPAYLNRVKARLADIDWPMIHAARESGGVLEADMSGRKAGGGKVPVRWRLVDVPEAEVGLTED